MAQGLVIRKTDSAGRNRAIRLMVDEFYKHLGKKAKKMFEPGGALAKYPLEKEDTRPDMLAQLRGELADEIKHGMYNREDREMEIAVRAMVIWFLRMEVVKRAAIIDTWGV
jgi:hypothetical protein